MLFCFILARVQVSSSRLLFFKSCLYLSGNLYQLCKSAVKAIWGFTEKLQRKDSFDSRYSVALLSAHVGGAGAWSTRLRIKRFAIEPWLESLCHVLGRNTSVSHCVSL